MFRSVIVRVAVAGDTPNKETEACDDEDSADDMSLLGLDLIAKLETDERNHCAHRKRSDNVACRRQRTDAG